MPVSYDDNSNNNKFQFDERWKTLPFVARGLVSFVSILRTDASLNQPENKQISILRLMGFAKTEWLVVFHFINVHIKVLERLTVVPLLCCAVHGRIQRGAKISLRGANAEFKFHDRSSSYISSSLKSSSTNFRPHISSCTHVFISRFFLSHFFVYAFVCPGKYLGNL